MNEINIHDGNIGIGYGNDINNTNDNGIGIENAITVDIENTIGNGDENCNDIGNGGNVDTYVNYYNTGGIGGCLSSCSVNINGVGCEVGVKECMVTKLEVNFRRRECVSTNEEKSFNTDETDSTKLVLHQLKQMEKKLQTMYMNIKSANEKGNGMLHVLKNQVNEWKSGGYSCNDVVNGLIFNQQDNQMNSTGIIMFNDADKYYTTMLNAGGTICFVMVEIGQFNPIQKLIF